jgi:hypothetical protein
MPRAKAVDAKAAKAKRQKKLAIGGGVLLLLLLAYQVPKTLKMLNPPPPARPAAAPQPAAGSTNAVSAAPVAGGSPVALVLSAPVSPQVQSGQLSRLSPRFSGKDPFRQQLSDATATPASAAPAAGPAPAAAPKRPQTQPQQPASVRVVPAAPAAPAAPKPTAKPSAKAPAGKKAAPVYRSATISLNGTKEDVDVGSDFPSGSPLFHLVALGAKTARIAVAGGSFASGAPTLTLHEGRPLTLANVADGTRYTLVLVATSTSAAAPAPAAAAAAATTTTPQSPPEPVNAG